MQSFCWHVLANPEIHRKLIAELLNSDLSPIVQYDEGIKIPYFQACLKETMRLQPALPFNITRTVPDEGATVDGISLPGGTRVAVSSWVIHRAEEVFGLHTHLFKPERWLELDVDRLKKMERCMSQVCKPSPEPLGFRNFRVTNV
jgi:cytochrome P450